MTRTLLASMRRVKRLMRPSKLVKASQSFMLGSAIASLAAIKPKKVTVPKVGRKLGTGILKPYALQSRLPGQGVTTTRREVAPHISNGAQYLTRTHRSAAGSRLYRLYIPGNLPKRPNGLILMLHGCNQTPNDFAIGTHMNALAEKHGLIIAYPAQSGGHNAVSCWNWFKPGNQLRGAGEPSILASLARKLMREFDVGRDGCFVAGLSAGGAMAAILADVYPDVFSAAGIHSGLARGSAHSVMSAMSAMRNGGKSKNTAPILAARPETVRRIVFQGDADSTVHPSNASKIVAAAMGNHAVPVKVSQRSVRGRDYARSEYAGKNGQVLLELWMLEGSGHAWSGGRAAGSYTDAKGPDASAQMIRFFLEKSA